MKTIYTKFLMMFVLLFLISHFSFGQKTIMFLGRENSPDSYAADRDMVDSLTAWGYTIDYWDDSDFQTITPDYTGVSGIFVNEPVDSKTVGGFGPDRDNYPVPMITTEGWAPRTDRSGWGWVPGEADMVTAASYSDKELSIIIKDNSHYITEIFNLEEVVQWSSNTTDEFTVSALSEVNVQYTGKLAKNYALADDATHWNLITIEPPELPNRVVYWGISSTGLNGAGLTEHYGTPDYYKIMKRACEWAYDTAGVSTGVNKQIAAEQFSLRVFPNPASEQVSISFNTPGDADAEVILYNITGSQVEILLDKHVQTGENIIRINAEKYAAGVYFVKLQIDGNSSYAKLIIQ
jgi:hypothetical protein